MTDHIRTTQQAFHPMRGHVAAGTVIDMDNGATLRIEPTMTGWRIVSADTGRAMLQCSSAADVERFIVRHC